MKVSMFYELIIKKIREDCNAMQRVFLKTPGIDFVAGGDGFCFEF